MDHVVVYPVAGAVEQVDPAEGHRSVGRLRHLDEIAEDLGVQIGVLGDLDGIGRSDLRRRLVEKVVGDRSPVGFPQVDAIRVKIEKLVIGDHDVGGQLSGRKAKNGCSIPPAF